MKKLVIAFVTSFVGVLIAKYYVSGFSIPQDWKIIAEVALALALINITVKPLLTFIFKPFIILSLGVLYFVIAGVLLWFADYFIDSISFASLTDLFYTAIILSLTNTVISTFVK